MALTAKQKQELQIAQTRVNQGTGTDTDRANLDFAKSRFGFTPSAPQPGGDRDLSNLESSLQQAQDTATQIQQGVSDLQNQQTVDNSDLISSSESIVRDEQLTTEEVNRLSSPNRS